MELSRLISKRTELEEALSDVSYVSEKSIEGYSSCSGDCAGVCTDSCLGDCHGTCYEGCSGNFEGKHTEDNYGWDDADIIDEFLKDY